MDFAELESFCDGVGARAAYCSDAVYSAYYNRSNEGNNFFDQAGIEEGAEESASPLYEDGGDLPAAEEPEESFEVHTIVRWGNFEHLDVLPFQARTQFFGDMGSCEYDATRFVEDVGIGRDGSGAGDDDTCGLTVQERSHSCLGQ